MRSRIVAIVVSMMAAILLGSLPASAQVKVTGDKFSKDISFEGAPVGLNPLGGTFRMWRIRSWVNRETKVARHQLYVDTSYNAPGWRFYERAADEDANTLEFVKIASAVKSCSIGCFYDETFGMNLPDATLRAKSNTGLQIKIFATSGDSLVLDISATQIAAQLRAIDGYQAGAASAGNAAVLPLPPQAFGASFGTAKPIWGLPGGALISFMNRDSVASRSGLKWADAIVEWNGQTISSEADMQSALSSVQAGQKIPFKALRARKIIDRIAVF